MTPVIVPRGLVEALGGWVGGSEKVRVAAGGTVPAFQTKSAGKNN